MTKERFNTLLKGSIEGPCLNLTPEEVAEGWHYCNEFDGLLVCSDPKQEFCGQHCVDAECGPAEPEDDEQTPSGAD